MQDDFRPTGPAKSAPKLKPKSNNTTNKEQAAPFQTPDQVREHEQADTFQPVTDMPQTPSQGTGHHWFNIPWPPTRHEIIAGIALLLIAIVGVGAFIKLHPAPVHQPASIVKQPIVAPAPKPTTVPSNLSGLPVATEANQRPVIGVMIENSAAARPQAGLSQAGVVFEAIAEGGITRFLALFQDQQPSNVGPIRSARSYYVQWNEGFRAAYAHVGGSPEALDNIKSWNVQDLNQYANGGAFHRDGSRPSPHNMYASIDDLTQLASQKGYKSEFTSIERKSSSPSKQPTATTIDLNLSSALYNVQYSYDAASNSYRRSEGGSPQLDSNTNTQLAPKVVIAIAVPVSAGGKTSQGGSYSNYNPIGSGGARIFQDGVMTEGTWSKASNTASMIFTDTNGTVIKLNPGQTWISAVTAISKAVYK